MTNINLTRFARSITRSTRALGLSALMLAGSTVALTACATTQTHGEQLDDTNLKNAVGRALTADEGVKRYQIDVDVLSQVVYLRGEVDNIDQKYRATEIALGVDGVDHVHNQLDIGRDRDVADGHPDAWITTAIAAKLAGDDTVKSRNVDVDTEDGVVTLSGIVEDGYAWRQAELLAYDVDGVIAVANELQIDRS